MGVTSHLLETSGMTGDTWRPMALTWKGYEMGRSALIDLLLVYNVCVISALLYDSETWTTYAGQEIRLNTFHLRSIRRIL